MWLRFCICLFPPQREPVMSFPRVSCQWFNTNPLLFGDIFKFYFKLVPCMIDKYILVIMNIISNVLNLRWRSTYIKVKLKNTSLEGMKLDLICKIIHKWALSAVLHIPVTGEHVRDKRGIQTPNYKRENRKSTGILLEPICLYGNEFLEFQVKQVLMFDKTT